MMRSRTLLTTLVVALFAAPAATATWYYHGTYEPDTAEDVTGGFMFLDPDTSPTGAKVYFNAYIDLALTGVNPNVGAAQTRIWAAPAVNMIALLGVWKDCNQDGAIGMADGALSEYRAELLRDPSVCPAGASPHHRGAWIYEFLWIGPADTMGDDADQAAYGTPGLINDTSARVWQDWGIPGAQPGQTCAITPLPAGSTGSTGGLIGWADCWVTNKAVQNAINAADAGCATPTPEMHLCIRGDPVRSDSVLNQQLPVHPWHDPYHPDSTGFFERSSDDPAFQAFDCSSPNTVESPVGEIAVYDETGQLPEDVEDPTSPGDALVTGVKDDEGRILALTDEDGTILTYGTPAPALLDPTGSLYDGANNTWTGAVGDCDPEGDGFYWDSVEGDHGSVDPTVKGRNEHDTSFQFYGFVGADDLGGLIGDDATPDDLGLTTQRNAAGISWYGTTTWVTDPQIVRTDTFTPAGPAYSTYYATVGDATFATGAVIPGTAAAYGAEWCDGATTGVKDGFDCDAGNWWNPIAVTGTSAPTISTGGTVTGICTTGRETPLSNCREMSVKPGQVYHLRDIDCYDGQVAVVGGVSVYASLVQLHTPTGCSKAP